MPGENSHVCAAAQRTAVLLETADPDSLFGMLERIADRENQRLRPEANISCSNLTRSICG